MSAKKNTRLAGLISPIDKGCFLPPHDLRCGDCPIFSEFYNQCSFKALNDIATSLENISSSLENAEADPE